MVRRAILDRAELPVDEHQILPDDDQPAADQEPQRSQPWRGAGGRWFIWAGRAVIWAVLLLIGYRGVLAIVHDESGTGAARPATAPPAARSTTTTAFPVSLAEAYALDFGTAYLNFSPATANQRAHALAGFISSGADPQLGWNGAGSQRLESEQVAGISVQGQSRAVVTLLATVSGGRMLELGVPVYVSHGRISVSGAPALLGPPARATLPSSTASADQATVSALQRQLPAFFQAYASGDPATLTRFVAPGGHVKGLGGLVTFGGIDAVFAPAGGSTRSVTVTVTWQLPSAGKSAKVTGASAALQMTYQLIVVRQGGSWDVRTIGALTSALSSGPP
jgi:Conjugative transposon protein TcpC